MSVYVDGVHLHTQKLHYISAYPGGATASPGFPISVYAYVGTPPQLRYCQRRSGRRAIVLIDQLLLASVY